MLTLNNAFYKAPNYLHLCPKIFNSPLPKVLSGSINTEFQSGASQIQMGNYRFRLSDMIPNAWFYKLKDMNKSRKQCSSHTFKRKTDSSTTTASQRSSFSQSRYSYYFKQPIRQDHKFSNSPEFVDLPRKSSKKTSRRKTVYKPSPKFASFSAAPTTRIHLSDYSSSPIESSTEGDFNQYPESESDREDDAFSVPDSVDHRVPSWSSSCNCKVSSSTADFVIDMNEESYERKFDKIDGFDPVFELDLPPILTKAINFNEDMNEVPETHAHTSFSVKQASVRPHRERKTSPRRSSSNSPGIRLRSNSPRIASKKLQAYARKSTSSRNKILSESFAVVKCSVDPLNDFRDSMMEMILENKIEGSKDLEELLACYLSLNSKEYHTLIVKAFELIWFDMTDA